MDASSIRDTVLDLLIELAPECSREEIDLEEDLREQLDIDSMDLHQFAGRIYEKFGVDVPEEHRVELTTVVRCVAWIEGHAGDAQRWLPPR